MTYSKPLDTIRALAAMLVLVWHWLPEDNLLNTFENGFLGVNLFFVLSGFLITRILLAQRVKAEERNASMLAVTGRFYMRRVLRIFPLYYFVIILLLLFFPVREAFGGSLPSLLTYTSNFYFFNQGGWEGLLGHFWSLAVEEQFYFIWPWLMLFCRRKWLPYIIGLAIFTGVLSQCLLYGSSFHRVITSSCFDAFGVGALLAWMAVFRIELLPRIYRYLPYVAGVCLAIMVIQSRVQWPWLPLRTVHAVASISLIAFVLIKEPVAGKWFRFVFCNPALIFIGRISYGMYVYHPLVRDLCKPVLHDLNVKYLPAWYGGKFLYILAFEYFIVLIIVAWLSWVLLERPFLSLKKNFA